MNEFEKRKLLVHCANCKLNFDYCPECQRKTLADYRAGMLAASEVAKNAVKPTECKDYDWNRTIGALDAAAAIEAKAAEIGKRK